MQRLREINGKAEMEMKNNENKNFIQIIRALSVLVLILFLANTVMCMLYSSMEAGHHCNHDDCPICETILLCEKNLRDICNFFAIILVPYGLMYFVDYVIKKIQVFFTRMTLVNQGVRLNN